VQGSGTDRYFHLADQPFNGRSKGRSFSHPPSFPTPISLPLLHCTELIRLSSFALIDFASSVEAQAHRSLDSMIKMSDSQALGQQHITMTRS
jgi:hypothetical protein